MDITKQTEYWSLSAQNDIETAELLIKNKRMLHWLFFCHLSIEKILKAHVVLSTSEIAPEIHNLTRLAEKAKLTLEPEQLKLLDILMIYQLEGRYPENFPVIPTTEFANDCLSKTKELLLCLKKKL